MLLELSLIGLIVSLTLYIRYITIARDLRTFIDRRTLRRRGSYGFIYFYTHRYIWRVFPVVKIGRAGDTVARLLPQRTPSPFGLKILGVVMVADEIKAETRIHRKFSRERIYDNKRNEWFWLSFRLWWFIYSVRDKKFIAYVRKETKSW